MMKNRSCLTIWTLFAVLSLPILVQAQVSINENNAEPDPSAMLDVQSTDKGVLIPRMSSSQRLGISSPAEGLAVYDTSTESYWYHDGMEWTEIQSGTSDFATEPTLPGFYSLDANNDLPLGCCNWYTQGTFWQSFTVERSGILDKIELLFTKTTNANPIFTNLVLYRGQGTGTGEIVFTGGMNLTFFGDAWATVPLGNSMPVKAGEVYTIAIYLPMYLYWTVSPDQYPGGRSSESASEDCGFRTYINRPDYNVYKVDTTNNSLSFANDAIQVQPNGIVSIENTNPTFRLVDDRTQASGTGNLLGTLEWMTRDASHSTAFTPTGKIELVNTNNSASPDARMDFVVWEDGSNGRFERRPLSLWPNGNVAVGDGASNPTKAKLEIVGSGSSYTVSGLSRYYGNGGSNSNSNYSSTFSLYANGIIGASAYVAHSDMRIKQIEGLSNSEVDLETLMQIEVTDYRLIDSLAKGNTPVKKVIAQQVAEVYPQAVTNDLTEVVPDIYQRAEMQDGWIMLATNLVVGERVKLISEESNAVYELIAVEANRFQVLEPASQNASLAQTPSVFVFGREVNDFHTVDYEALSMLNVSATQELKRQIEQLRKEKPAFEARLQALEAMMIDSK